MDELNRLLGIRLKALRQQRGWSLDRTAQQCQVSKAMLGQIERGESSPTVVTLWRIASGFGVSFSELLADQEPGATDWNVWWRGPISPASTLGDGIQVTTLLPYEAALGYELLLVELPVGCCYFSVAHEEGTIEQILPLSGQMSLWYDEAWHSLLPSQALRFAADRAHGYRNDDTQIVRFHNLIFYPRRSRANPLLAES